MAHCKICTNDNFDEWYACANCYNLYLISDIEKLKADLALAQKRVEYLWKYSKLSCCCMARVDFKSHNKEKWDVVPKDYYFCTKCQKEITMEQDK